MKRILFSLLTVGVVTAVGVTATRAFFSDVETSTGNTFTAGKVDLQIDYDGYYNKAPTGTPTVHWDLTDLITEKFFVLTDVKPGDYGEGTISYHVLGNTAWGCVSFKNLVDADNSCTEPEKEKEGECGTTGELSDNLYFAAWLEDDGNNIFDGTETLLFSGKASDTLNGNVYTLADAGTVVPIPADTTKYLGIQWCAGTMTVVDHTITCATDMGNETQTDSVTADIEFYVEQSRNNLNFVCNSLVPTPTPTPGPG